MHRPTISVQNLKMIRRSKQIDPLSVGISGESCETIGTETFGCNASGVDPTFENSYRTGQARVILDSTKTTLEDSRANATSHGSHLNFKQVVHNCWQRCDACVRLPAWQRVGGMCARTGNLPSKEDFSEDLRSC